MSKRLLTIKKAARASAINDLDIFLNNAEKCQNVIEKAELLDNASGMFRCLRILGLLNYEQLMYFYSRFGKIDQEQEGEIG